MQCNSRRVNYIRSFNLILIFLLVLNLFSPVITPVHAQQAASFIQHDISAFGGDCKIIADIDNDGDKDVVLGGHSNAGENLTWYAYPDILTPTNGHYIATPLDEFTTDCAAADVDGDGDQDIIAPDGPGSSFANILWFENPLLPSGNPATGSWSKHTIANANSYAKDVHPADYNLDGLIDVAIRTADQVIIYFQTTPNNWSAQSTSIAYGEGMGSGDIDKDGDLDLILQGEWWENDGTNNVGAWSKHSIGSANSDFKAWMADINGDGINDILYSSSENIANVSWWQAPGGNVKQDNWTEHVIKANADRAHTLQTGDMDGDGDIDVIVGHMHTSSGNLYIYYNDNSQGTSWSQVQVGNGGIHNGRVADMDVDGDLDIYGANWTGNGNHSWWENKLDPVQQPLSLDNWQYQEVTNVGGGVRKDLLDGKPSFGLTFIDFTNDGYQDILAGNNYFINPGGDMTGQWLKGTFNGAITTDAKVTLNVDDDANVDVIGYGPNGNVYWMEYQANSWQYWLIGSIGYNAHGSGQGYRVADLIPGGKPEIVLNGEKLDITEERYRINYFEIPSNPEGLWIKHEITSDQNSPNGYATEDGLAVGDLNGDGRLDVASGGGEGYTVAWWSNNPDGSWTKYQLGTIDGGWTDMFEIADVNGDGQKDVIVGREDPSGQVYVFTNNGTNQNWPKANIFNGNNTASLDSGDIDLDGDVDIVVGEKEGSKRVIILENVDGQSGQFNQHLVGSAPNGGDNHVGTQLVDLDGDGDLDIVSVGYDAPEYVHLWINQAITGQGPSITPTPAPTTNQAPIVNAGIDQTLVMPTNSALLQGTVQDDGLPQGSQLSYSWSQANGPAAATITNSASLSTNVDVPEIGDYEFSLTVSDGELTASDVVKVSLLPSSQLPSSTFSFNLNETSGSIAHDSSGNNHHATLVGANWSAGKLGNGLLFHGTGTPDNLNVGAINVTGNQMSIALWIKPNDLSGNHDYRLISKASGMYEQDHDWMISTYNGNQIRLRLKAGGSTTTMIANNANLQVGQWAHVVATYDGSTMRLYKDGQQLASQSKSGTIGTSTNNVLIGANPNNYEVFNGTIDEVYVFPSVLTTAQITQLLNATNNIPPVVQNISLTTDEDSQVQTTLTGTDADNDPLTFSIVSDPQHGSISLVGNQLTYSPTVNYFGSDTFTYKANDGTSDSNIGTATLTINPVNDAPTAVISANPDQGTAPLMVTFDAAGSSDPDNDPLTFEWSLGGQATLSGQLVEHEFTQAGDYLITLLASDGIESANDAFTLHIDPFNNPPIADSQSVSLNEDSEATITLTGADVEQSPLTYALVSNPTHGTVSLNGQTATYLPELNYFGPDSFSFTVTDGDKISQPAIVNLTVVSVNDLPTAILNATPSTGSAPLLVNFSASESLDPDGTIVQYLWDFGDGATSSQINPSHTFTNSGAYHVNLQITDDANGQATQSVDIVVLPPNHAPVAEAIYMSLNEDNQQQINLVATDIDNDPISFNLKTQPLHGTAYLQNGVVTYTPELNYNGEDSFTYSATDGVDESNIATVSLMIDPINDQPLASFSVNQSSGTSPLTVEFNAASSSDPDLDPLSYAWNFGDGTQGTGSQISHSFTQAGSFQVILTVTDPGGLSHSANTTIVATSVLTDALSAYDFNQSTGTILPDISGNNHPGTVNGAQWSSGKSGNALLFDGQNDNVNLGNLNFSGNQMSIATWIYSNGFLDDDRIISKATGQQANDHYWMISIANGNRLRFRLKTGSSTKTLIASSATPINQWVHVVVTYNGSKMKIYRNGVEVASANASGNIATNSSPVYLGMNTGGYSPWNGKLDNLTLYTKALSAAEVATLYAQ